MNELILPKGSAWYLSGIMACTPDNTVVYGAKKDIVIIHPIQPGTPADIKVIYQAHKEQITAVATNSNWGQPDKLVATIGEDNVVCVWNVPDCTLKASHNAHVNNSLFGVGVSFVNSTVTSITENCQIAVWCISSNTARLLNLGKHACNYSVTCLSTCPHNSDLSAFGTRKGFIFVINTKGTGKILYKLRGHDYDIVSLSWCPSPYNVYKTVKDSQADTIETHKKPVKIDKIEDCFKIIGASVDKSIEVSQGLENQSSTDVVAKKLSLDESQSTLIDESVHVNDLIIPEKTGKKTSKPVDKKNPWGNLEFSDDEDANMFETSLPVNYLNECADLQKLILDANKEGKKANFNMNALQATLDEISLKEKQDKTEFMESIVNEILDKHMVENNEDNKEKNDFEVKESPESSIEKFSGGDISYSKGSDSVPSKSAGGSILDSEDVDSVSESDYALNNKARSYEELSETNKLQFTVEDIIEKTKFRESRLSTSISSSLNVEVDDSSVVDEDNVKTENTSFYLETEDFQRQDELDNVSDIKNDTEECKKLLDDLTSATDMMTSSEIDRRRFFESKQCSASISSSLHVEIDELSTASDDNFRTDVSMKSGSVSAEVSNDWRKSDNNVLQNDIIESSSRICKQFDKDMLLVSGCKGGVLYIWRAGGDGRQQANLKLPSKHNKYRKGSSDSLAWTAVCWMRPNLILVSSPTGELLAWNIPSNTNISKNSKPYRLIQSDHSSALYCIAAPCLEEDKSNVPFCAWTIGRDRQFLCTDLSSKRQMLASLPTFWGYIYGIAACPSDPNRLAIAVGDQSLCLFDLSRPHITNIRLKYIYRKIKGKVMVISWHPVKETCLAFATSEGRVGIFDTGNPTKDPILLHLYHRKSVYSLCWGPEINSDSNKMVLYACSEGFCTMYDSEKPNEVPPELKIPSKSNQKISDVSWNSNHNLVTVGFNDGSIMIAKRNFEPIVTFYDHKKNIQYLCWHPNCTISDDGDSPYKNWLATASSDNAVIVYNCGFNTNESDATLNKKVAVLNGHTMSVYKLAWSPHKNGLLASVSLDGTAMIWDVPSQTLLNTYMGHCGEGILCILWSPFDPDLIITGGKDCSLHIWSRSKYPPTLEKPTVNKINTKSVTVKVTLPDGTILKTTKDKTKEKMDNTVEHEKNTKKSDEHKFTKSTMLPLVSKQQNLQGPECIDACKRLLNKIDEKLAAMKSGESDMSESETWEDAESEGEQHVTVDQKINSTDHLRFFGTRQDMVNLLNLEQKGHENYGRWELHDNLSLWKGDIGSMIKNATEKKLLNDWHISVAPVVSNRLWLETCSAYAEQLIEKNEVIKAVSYLLTCHRVQRAIRALCDAKLFREALAIARCRLTADDPEINTILRKWAADADFTGSYQIAAECYICLGEFEEAAKVYAKRPNVKFLELALDLAIRSNNRDLIITLDERLRTELQTNMETETITENEV